MEKQELIKILEDNFINRWEQLGGHNSKNVTNKLNDYFLLDDMLVTINKRINNENSISDQITLLKTLSKRYATLLYSSSKRGYLVNDSSILEAQRVLKINSGCEIYPCTKLFR